MSKADKMVVDGFSTDDYKYKYLRMRTISRTILEIAGMINIVVGAVATLIAIFI